MKFDQQSELQQYSVKQVLEFIEKKTCFSGLVNDGSFYLRIDDYRPVICTAIHNGHHLRPELMKNCLLTPQERFYEEDPYTDELISSFPIVIVGNDSRFEYDLNRPLTQSTYYKSAWEKQVWKRKLSDKQRDVSHAKHKAFYLVVETLVAKLEACFKSCIVFDIHSYNYQRHVNDTPTFNIGTDQIDMQRWADTVDYYYKQLDKIHLPNLNVRVAINELFVGRGYLISHINARFDNTLVLPTEAKKVFMDETTGELYSLVLQDLRAGVKDAVTQTAAYFARKFSKTPGRKSVQKADMLSSHIESNVKLVDAELYALCKNLDTLSFINPNNLKTEKRRFLERKGDYSPDFRYRQLNFNPYALKANLYQLPVDTIEDAGLQQFYRSMVENLVCRIDMLASPDDDNFTFNSLRYFGKPDSGLLRIAEFIAKAPYPESTGTSPVFQTLKDVDYAVEFMRQKAEQWNIDCHIEKSSKTVAKIMLNHDKKALLLAAGATFTESELNAFAYHQLGIHMFASLNAHKQPLKILSIGLPGYNQTQEGLAVYSGYCSGTLTFSRLKTLALRVVAVAHMLSYKDFRRTYGVLIEDYQEDSDSAFAITARVYRRGGITKDYQYLSGFREILDLSESFDLNTLLAGKLSTTSLPILNEMINRGFVIKPGNNQVFMKTDKPSDPVVEYLVQTIRQYQEKK